MWYLYIAGGVGIIYALENLRGPTDDADLAITVMAFIIGGLLWPITVPFMIRELWRRQ